MSDEVGGIGDRRRGKDSSLDSVNKITSDLGKYRRKYINSYRVEASVKNRSGPRKKNCINKIIILILASWPFIC